VIPRELVDSQRSPPPVSSRDRYLSRLGQPHTNAARTTLDHNRHGKRPDVRTGRTCRRKQGAHDGRQIRVVHMQAAERGLSSDSRGARTDPALPEPLARFRGPLLVSAASGTQIESAPMATMQKSSPSELTAAAR
jgi:hypothetical protein